MTFSLVPNEEETTNIVFSNQEINIYGEDIVVDGTTVVIERPGSFLVTG